jgi:predicted deacetylase
MNLKFAIRDDDTSFWTKPEELERVYNDIWRMNIPVSLSVIPFSVRSYHNGDFELYYQDTDKRAIGENKELVEYLKKKINERKVSIMLHGYSHQYLVSMGLNETPQLATKTNLDQMRNFVAGSKLRWYGEYAWKDYERLYHETREGKIYLEDIFNIKIQTFIPPSNDISRNGVRAVTENNMDIVGSILLSSFNRPICLKSIKNYLKKSIWKLIFKDQYPFIMNYGTHREISATGIVPSTTSADMIDIFKKRRRLNAPFVISTHYWEMHSNEKMQECLKAVLNELRVSGDVLYTTVDSILQQF